MSELTYEQAIRRAKAKDKGAAMADQLTDFVNVMGNRDARDGFVERINCYHRTLQQGVMALFQQLAQDMANRPCDARNEAAIEFANRVSDIELHMPLI